MADIKTRDLLFLLLLVQVIYVFPFMLICIIILA